MAIITHNMTAMNTERHLEVSSKKEIYGKIVFRIQD